MRYHNLIYALSPDFRRELSRRASLLYEIPDRIICRGFRIFMSLCLMERLCKRCDIGLSVELDIIRAKITRKGGDIRKTKGAIIIKICKDHGFIGCKCFRRLRPVGKKRIIQPIIEHLSIFLAKGFEKRFQMLVLFSVFFTRGIGKRFMKIAVDGRIFEENSLVRFDFLGWGQRAVIRKVRERCFGVFLLQLL